MLGLIAHQPLERLPQLIVLSGSAVLALVQVLSHCAREEEGVLGDDGQPCSQLSHWNLKNKNTRLREGTEMPLIYGTPISQREVNKPGTVQVGARLKLKQKSFE